MIFFNDKNCLVVKFDNSSENLSKLHLITSIEINNIHYGFYLNKKNIENVKSFLFIGKFITFPAHYRKEFALIQNICNLPKINKQTSIRNYFFPVNLDVVRKYFKIDDDVNIFKVKCVFHDDKNPSMTVDLEKGLFYCFGCCSGGKLVKLIHQIKNVVKKH